MRTRKLKTISTESKDRYMIKIQSSKNIYAPPSSPPKQKRRNERQNRKLDSIDKIVSKIDEQDDDKYRTPAIDNDLSTLSSHPTDTEQPQEILSGLSSALSSNLESNGTGSASHISLLSSGYTTDQQSQTELGMFSADSEDPAKVQAREVNELYQMLDDDDDDRTQQRLSYISITICSFQVLILALQLSLCGVAPLDVNPLIGVFPDAISDWGGKNPYLMKSGEWWRLITPAFLHVGVLQFIVNAAVQLHTCAFFEREWGSISFVWIYAISEVGCIIVSSCMNPDSLAVGSSGALMGLFGAKLAQVITHLCFDINKSEVDVVRLEQMSSILCSMSVILAVSFFTYIDWSGHMGALAAGYIVGMISFSRPIRSKCTRTIMRLVGIVLLSAMLIISFHFFLNGIEPDEDLADPCEYFRNLYNEAHECECTI
mmetsp:Transcript_25540/g.38570  ORF Transcript_25540/g.38570 Transcript_25540/m.38570 type:complete len:429 (-) Transcript_25540:35-1321(-)